MPTQILHFSQFHAFSVRLLLLCSLGMVLDNQGKHQEALEHYIKSLEIKAKAFGPDHPDVADTCMK